MNCLYKYYSEVDKKLLEEITSLCNNRDSSLAIQKINKRLEKLPEFNYQVQLKECL